MSADKDGHPYIASYWRDAGTAVPQSHAIYHTGKQWETRTLAFRSTPFSLSGQGTKRIPIARPQILVNPAGPGALLVFRDEERHSKVSVAQADDPASGAWRVRDLTSHSVGDWEPSYDTERWRQSGILSLLVQDVRQVDGEGKADVPPQPVQVLDWQPDFIAK